MIITVLCAIAMSPRGEVEIRCLMPGVGKEGANCERHELMPTNFSFRHCNTQHITYISTTSQHDATEAKQYLAYRHVCVRARNHVRSCLLSFRRPQQSCCSLPSVHQQDKHIHFKPVLHHCRLCDNNLTPAHWASKHSKTEHSKTEHWRLDFRR
jgi:hypothetical protein